MSTLTLPEIPAWRDNVLRYVRDAACLKTDLRSANNEGGALLSHYDFTTDCQRLVDQFLESYDAGELDDLNNIDWWVNGVRLMRRGIEHEVERVRNTPYGEPSPVSMTELIGWYEAMLSNLFCSVQQLYAPTDE